MAYQHTTYAQLKAQLSARLGDTSELFWTDIELGLHIQESLRTFGLCAGFWRERGTINSAIAIAFYDIQATLSNGISLILNPTITDQNIIQQLQYALLESASSQTSWTGTEMFTYNDLVNAIQNRLNQFLSDTGCVVNRSLVNVLSPPIGRQVLDQKTIDVRRMAWLGASPLNYYVPLWREDERLLTAADQGWSVNPGTPEAYSVMAPPPLQVQLSPIPQSSGQIEVLTVDSTTLNPASMATVLGIPDQLTPAVKWGALADLLGKDGIARDPARSQYCEQRYMQYVQLARALPVVIHAEINGVPLIPCTLQEEESANPLWENSSGAPTDLILAAPNLIALNPVPDGVYSVACDVVREPPIPVNDGDFVQVGREQMDMILDYAEHLALFKVYGAEWHATDRQAMSFFTQALTYNQRISASARSSLVASMQSQRQKHAIPRRLNQGSGVGTLVSNGRN